MYRNIIEPLTRRAGTAFAAFLIAKGLPADLAHQLALAAAAVVAVGADLALSYFDRTGEK